MQLFFEGQRRMVGACKGSTLYVWLLWLSINLQEKSCQTLEETQVMYKCDPNGICDSEIKENRTIKLILK